MAYKWLVGLLLVLLVVWVVVTTKGLWGRGKVMTKATDKAQEALIEPLTEASNSDGSLRLRGSREIKEGGTRFVFKIDDTVKNTSTLLFDTTAGTGETYLIPFNSWSSDNKHVFLQQNGRDGRDYLVFKADGSMYDDGKKFLEVGEYWKQSKNPDLIDHVSGWAGADLLVTYMTRPDGTGSSAYWFVIGSRKFMQVREL